MQNDRSYTATFTVTFEIDDGWGCPSQGDIVRAIGQMEKWSSVGSTRSAAGHYRVTVRRTDAHYSSAPDVAGEWVAPPPPALEFRVTKLPKQE